MLSDEPCWGQFTPTATPTPPVTSFSALRRAVLGSIAGAVNLVLAWGAFQCSPTSRVGVNRRWRRFRSGGSSSFSALRRAVLGSIRQRRWTRWRRCCFSALRRAVLGSIWCSQQWPPGCLRFQCSPTSRVGVNQSLVSVQSGTATFQCSPTSRVGVNQKEGPPRGAAAQVSVLSDEPCWGQYAGGATRWRRPRCFSALRRAVLGSMSLSSERVRYILVVSVLSDEPCWGQLPWTPFASITPGVSVLSDEPCWGQCKAGRRSGVRC